MNRANNPATNFMGVPVFVNPDIPKGKIYIGPDANEKFSVIILDMPKNKGAE